MELPSNGVLPVQWLERALHERVIDSPVYSIPQESIQPASLDLRLGERAYRLRCSFLPGSKTVEERLEGFVMDEIDLRDGGDLAQNRPYLVPLLEELNLPANVRARANPKSSTGRLDVFTRVITDGGTTFDDIRPQYRGKLWLEIVPLSFTVRVRTRLSLNQLRLIAGDARRSDEEIRELHRQTPILFVHDVPLPEHELRISGGGVFLSLDLMPDAEGVIGFRARHNSHLVDMTSTAHDPAQYWEAVRAEDGGFVLEPEDFYLLMSREAVRVPPPVAGEMTAYDPTNGELRTHYAGFFDPGFGHDASGASVGSRAALEVRAHDVPFLIEAGQPVCKLVFERMLEEPRKLYGDEIGSSYQGQTTTLGKHFTGSFPRPAP